MTLHLGFRIAFPGFDNNTKIPVSLQTKPEKYILHENRFSNKVQVVSLHTLLYRSA